MEDIEKIPEKYADAFLKDSFQKIRTLMQQRSIRAELILRKSLVRRKGQLELRKKSIDSDDINLK